MKSILDLIADGTFPAEMEKPIKETTITKRVTKGQILLKKGDLQRKSYFVKSGCLRSYTVDDKDKEHIYMFAPEGWLISDIDAHVNNKPALLYIDAVEDSEIEVLDNGLFSSIAIATPEALTKLNKRISVLQNRIIMLMSASLQERYLHFMETYPDIIKRVPQKMVASYLGVTPEALSKIRGEMSKSR